MGSHYARRRRHRRAIMAGASSRSPLMPTPRRWDIFGRIVDNYGDAGVCWRLARQLVVEHAQDVTLWQDDLRALARIAPGIDPARDLQQAAGVTVRRWAEPFAPDAPRRRRHRGLGCGLPESYVAAMARAATAPAWFILEYLSAETWVDGSHGLPSPHPRPAAAAPLLVPRLHGGNRRAPPRARPLRGARRVPARRRRATGAVVDAPGAAAGTGRNPRVAVLLSESRIARSSRRMGRWRRTGGLPRARRRGGRRARRLDRRRRAASGASIPARAPVAARNSFRRAGRLRPPALAIERQLRPRRGFVRPRAMGRAPIRMAHLSADRRRALAQARRLRRSLQRRVSPWSRRQRCGGSGAPGTGRRTPARSTRPGRISWPPAPIWRPMRTRGPRSLPRCPTSLPGWSRPPHWRYN